MATSFACKYGEFIIYVKLYLPFPYVLTSKERKVHTIPYRHDHLLNELLIYHLYSAIELEYEIQCNESL